MAHLDDIQTRFPTNDALSRVKESGCNEGILLFLCNRDLARNEVAPEGLLERNRRVTS